MAKKLSLAEEAALLETESDKQVGEESNEEGFEPEPEIESKPEPKPVTEPSLPEIDFDDKESIRAACKAGRIDPAVFEDKYPDETL